MTSLTEIVIDAVRLLDEAGWCQGQCTDSTGGICVGTALWDAAGLPHNRDLTPAELTIWVGITDAVIAAISENFPGMIFTAATAIPKFNDFSSQEDVRLVLKTIIERGGL